MLWKWKIVNDSMTIDLIAENGYTFVEADLIK